ncbi:hypothetical protein DFP72DRAFT_915964 [Ephemerocybe angulata]|uniref:MYND-type domain-containing protein n=1 Tax=Ephemerocybe angulata TaxID=980116 RepID=A0A8H6HL63_9AGAR|nr:hypothetical protein DFP72DRAFT_915964 [Tulosesus angulatus]
MRAIPDSLESGTQEMKYTGVGVYEFIYSTTGARDVLNRCSRPECRKKELAKGTYKFCSGCRLVCYCNAKCQKGHWKSHKEVCKEQSQCIASGAVAPPMRIVKLIPPIPVSFLTTIGICSGSGRMVNSMQNRSNPFRQGFGAVVLISDFLS